VQPFFQRIEFAIDGNAQRLKTACRRMLARWRTSHHVRDQLSEFARARQRRFAAALDDRACDAAAHAFLAELPQHVRDLALVGVYLFDRTINTAVRAIAPSPRGELEITDAIQWLIDEGHRVRMEILTGWWIDTGKLTPLLEANRLILERIETRIDGRVDDDSAIDGRVIVEVGAEIINSTIRGPVAIGAGTRVVDSFIGPFSAIGAGCLVQHSEVEHSVVMENSQIIDIPRLEDSLIGSDALVSRTKTKPRAVRLMVGDHCQIDLE